MRAFLISITLLLTVSALWCGFDLYSDAALTDFTDRIHTEILPSVEQEDWPSAVSDFSVLGENWETYRRRAAFFLGTGDLNEISEEIAKTARYIKAQDVSNASGELACLADMLLFLHQNESVTPANIL